VWTRTGTRGPSVSYGQSCRHCVDRSGLDDGERLGFGLRLGLRFGCGWREDRAERWWEHGAPLRVLTLMDQESGNRAGDGHLPRHQRRAPGARCLRNRRPRPDRRRMALPHGNQHPRGPDLRLNATPAQADHPSAAVRSRVESGGGEFGVEPGGSDEFNRSTEALFNVKGDFSIAHCRSSIVIGAEFVLAEGICNYKLCSRR
jgi:hypothetical protein